MSSYSYTFDAKTTGESKLLALLKSIDDGVKKLVDGYQKYGAATSKVTVNVNNYSRATHAAGKSSASFAKTIHGLAHAWVLYNKAADYAAKRIRQFTGIFTNFISKVREIGGAFQDSAAEFRAYAESARASKEQIKAVTEQSKLLGRTTQFTAKQSMDSAVTMVKAGENIINILRDQKGVLLGASAANLSMSKSAAVSAHAQKFFGKEVKNAEEALKMQVATASAADVTVLQLDASLTKGAGAANRANQSFSRFNAAIALFAEKSIKSGKAGNDYLRIITALTARTPRAEKAIRKLGVSVTEMRNGKEVMRDLGAVFEDIQQSLQGFDFTQQSKLLKDLFGRGLLNSAQVFLNAGITGFDEMEKKILNSLDAMKKLEQYKAEGMTRSFVEFQSAVEGVYVELTDILKVPIREYWQTLGKILNVVSDRIKDVAQAFSKGKMTIQEWRDVMQKEGMKGLFSGISGELKEEMESLKQIFLAGFDTLKALLVEFWRAIAPSIEPVLEKVGETLGETLGKAIVGGMKTLLTSEIPKALAEFKQEGGLTGMGVRKGVEIREGIEEGKGGIGKFFQGLFGGGRKRPDEEAAAAALEQFYKDQEVKARKPGPLPFEQRPPAAPGIEAYRTPKDRALRELVTQRRAKREKLREFQELPEEEQQRRLRQIGRKGVREAQEEAAPSKEQLEGEIKLIETRKQYNEQVSRSATLMDKVKLTIIDMEASTKKYLLAPFDAFLKKINSIRSTFDDVLAGLQQKTVDIKVRFLGLDEKGATSKRRDILEKQLTLAQKRIQQSQLAGEKAGYQEKAAGLAEQLASLGGAGQKEYAKKAVSLLGGAEKSRLKEEEIAIDTEKIARKSMLEQIPLLEKMRGEATSATHLTEILSQLQEAYKSTGAGGKVQQIQQELSKATLESSKESHELMLKQVSLLQRLVDIEEKNAVSNETTAGIVKSDTGPPVEPVVFGS